MEAGPVVTADKPLSQHAICPVLPAGHPDRSPLLNVSNLVLHSSLKQPTPISQMYVFCMYNGSLSYTNPEAFDLMFFFCISAHQENGGTHDRRRQRGGGPDRKLQDGTDSRHQRQS